MIKIWQRYIFKEVLTFFFFFLFSFFLLYFLADFSTHIQDFLKDGHLSFGKMCSYYLHQFFKKEPLLFPLAFLIATIKVLSSLNAHRELVALQASGLPLKKILHPFWALAFFCSFFGYINEEVVIPKLAIYLEEAKQARSKNSAKVSKKPFTVLYLKDSSKLVYQRIDKEKNAFFDVYWIRSFQDIWKIKYLHLEGEKPLGQFVDHLTRNEKGILEKKESYEQCILPSLKWKTSDLYQKQYSAKHHKISKLAKDLLKQEGDSFHAKGEIATYFFHKLFMPLLPFLILLGIAPYCVVYSRSSPTFLLYLVSIFCFVVFSTLVDSLLIIGINQTLPPVLAMGGPFVCCFIGCFWKFRQLFVYEKRL